MPRPACRAEGNFDGGAAEAGISLSDKLKALKDTTIGKGADGNASIIQTNFELRSKLTGLEETNAAMLSKALSPAHQQTFTHINTRVLPTHTTAACVDASWIMFWISGGCMLSWIRRAMLLCAVCG